MSTVQRIGALALTLYILAPGAAPGEAWTFRVEPEQTRAAFAVSYLGFAKQRGLFARTSGTIVIDREHKVGSVDLVIDVKSVDTGWDLRDGFLRGENMFDAERYPTLRFRSTRLDFDDERLVAVDGEMTLRGVTVPAHFDVLRLACATDSAHGRESCDATVSGRISRSAFGMDFAYPLIGDEVDLDIALKAVSTPRETAMQ